MWKLGRVPNLIATMAQSTSVARDYLDLADSLSGGVLEEPLRVQRALAVSEANGCRYCVAGHSAVGSCCKDARPIPRYW
jgi:alkylhydroperoxidase family enzyme